MVDCVRWMRSNPSHQRSDNGKTARTTRSALWKRKQGTIENETTLPTLSSSCLFPRNTRHSTNSSYLYCMDTAFDCCAACKQTNERTRVVGRVRDAGGRSLALASSMTEDNPLENGKEMGVGIEYTYFRSLPGTALAKFFLYLRNERREPSF